MMLEGGTSLALEHLNEIGDIPKFCVVAEPIYDKKLVSIKVGRRGSINGKIVVADVRGGMQVCNVTPNEL